MNNLKIKTGGAKFIIGWLAVFLIRLVPFRSPNFEPMLATIMPYSKKYSVLASFAFGFLGILAIDVVMAKIGMWTFVTAFAYGFLGVWAYYYFKNRESNIKNYVTFGVLGTILYDAVTGLSVGPLFFGQSFVSAFVGQIPFTLMHLGGTVFFAIALSPALYRWVVINDVLEIPALLGKLPFGFSKEE